MSIIIFKIQRNLVKWVQTGLVSLVSILAFYLLFLRKTISYYKTSNMESFTDRIGFGCMLAAIGYMVCSLFTDSTIFTTPTFYVLVGISLSVLYNKSTKITQEG